MNAAADDHPAGRPHGGLHDLVARHFDGGLSAAEQRHLAERLAASSEARQVLARFLRLEGAAIRLAAAGLLPPPAAAQAALVAPIVATPSRPAASAVEPAVGPPRRPPFALPAIAGGLLAAIVTATAVSILPRSDLLPRPDRPRGDIAAVADRWIELRRAPQSGHTPPGGGAGADGGADLAQGAVELPAHELPADHHAANDHEAVDHSGSDHSASDQPAGGASPPDWLVAAVADEAAEPPNPDKS